MQTKLLSPATVVAVFASLALVWAPLALQAQSSSTETIVLSVEGMWEEGCEDYLSDSLLGDLAGVHDVHADHENDAVTVDFDPAEVSAERIVAAIEDCPSFDVTGSATHVLDEGLIEENRRFCCNSACRHRGA